jgi:hypothetical protein
MLNFGSFINNLVKYLQLIDCLYMLLTSYLSEHLKLSTGWDVYISSSSRQRAT